MTEQERRDRWAALGIRTDRPYPARVYDYLPGPDRLWGYCGVARV